MSVNCVCIYDVKEYFLKSRVIVGEYLSTKITTCGSLMYS